MLKVLATTENAKIKNQRNRYTIAGIGQKSSGKLLFAISRHIHRVELSSSKQKAE